MKHNRIGLDVGSTTLKVVVLDDHDNICFSTYVRHNARIRETLSVVFSELGERFGDELFSLTITGSVGLGIAERTQIPFVQEVVASTAYVRRYHPQATTLIDIGGEDSRPIYLTVNKKEMEMHNIEEDNTTLYFASSSAVECRIARVYYTDKFGQTQQTTNAGSIAGMGITATPDPGLNGNIDIYSPLPTNNTIRYIDLEVTNEDGVTRTVTIAQYPLEYITNILGWYSYRDDFGGTTYELLAGQNVDGKTFDSDSRISNWICGCTWSRNQWSYGKTETGFFRLEGCRNGRHIRHQCRKGPYLLLPVD